MEKFVVAKSQPLSGTVRIGGSKNAVLPILAATLLTRQTCVVKDAPALSDVRVMEEILNALGARTKRDAENGWFSVTADDISDEEIPYELASKMRASFLIAGALLARKGVVKAPLPGGCAIGSRPVELHLKGFTALGARIEQEHGSITLTAKNGLKGGRIYLDFPSVGATENIIMAASLADGVTVIENCAVEPEIVDLANFLNAMGADVRGAGTGGVRVKGVERLDGCEHTIIPDRIEAGTFMIASVMTKGDIEIENVVWDHLKPIVAKLNETNIARVEQTENGARARCVESHSIKGVDIKTMPYPGFPTDLQAQFMSLLCLSEGTSVVTETVFENRFMHVGELRRMGADIKIESHSAIIEGVRKLTGCKVKATDLRAGAALILSGLRAEGETEIGDIFHVDRGYCDFEEKLKKLGANIKRVNE
ncbi:MAG: UDP-N-acetylglucosamine 1-carboxyvinyltransferase [Clostridiales bacterium]|nr:UDP-N-acetylglucosamine 1-carboxyvinyltransferase [Clostridiales bacterium]